MDELAIGAKPYISVDGWWHVDAATLVAVAGTALRAALSGRRSTYRPRHWRGVGLVKAAAPR